MSRTGNVVIKRMIESRREPSMEVQGIKGAAHAERRFFPPPAIGCAFAIKHAEYFLLRLQRCTIRLGAFRTRAFSKFSSTVMFAKEEYERLTEGR